LLGKGDQPLKHVALKLGIGIEHQHPAALELGEHGVEGAGFSSSSLAAASHQVQKRMVPLQLLQQLGGAVLTAVIDDPELQPTGGVTKLGDALHQATDHRLLIPGRHHHIDGRQGCVPIEVRKGLG
jgi:hypothetical protein